MEQRSARTRWLIVFGLAILWVVVVLLRLSYLQLYRYSDYLARAQRQQQRIVEVSPKRGVIYDRNGRELAMSVSVDSCFADPDEISDPEMVASLLSRVLGTPVDELQEKLAESKTFVWIARKLPPETVSRIQALNLKGIYFQKENQRFYPEKTLAAHVLGYVDVDEHGLGGIEYALDKDIRGRPGRVLAYADARRRWYDRTQSAVDAGANVVLTLDENIQYIAEKELSAAIAQTHAKAGVIVVQDTNTGEPLAIANWPTFDANKPAASSDDSRMDRAVTAAYEPGSTFKLITLTGAIAEGITNPAEIIDCQLGLITVAGRLIHDWHPFGMLSVTQILEHSSDVGAIKLALRLGAPKFYHYMRAFGFGQITGIELPGENRGLLRQIDHWTPSSIGSLAMGQEVSVTPIQMVSAVSAIANGGMVYKPRVVREIRRGNAVQMIAAPDPQRALDPTTAATLRLMMEGVVNEGTGKSAALNGYSVAGKTGTAQKIDPATGRYSKTQYVASFIGFTPVNTPAVTILVAIDSPVGAHHGGQVGGPIFRRVAEQVLAYMAVPHDLPIIPEAQWAAHHRDDTETSEGDSDFIPMQTQAVSEEPVPAATSQTSQTIAFAEGEGVAVPDLAGQTVRGVTQACSKLGLTPVLVGSGIAVDQSPAAGTRLARGSRVTVRFGRSPGLVPALAREN
jgi:cell division protein FtsI (penicillin-binding protein 3)